MVALALIIAASPLSVIPAVLVLHTPRPKLAGLAFLAGRAVGLPALTVVFVGLSDLLGGGLDKPPSWASWLRIALGAPLIVVGVWPEMTQGGCSLASRDPTVRQVLTARHRDDMCKRRLADAHRSYPSRMLRSASSSRRPR
jgi:hypothetical protein